jgi:hypothetical protein
VEVLLERRLLRREHRLAVEPDGDHREDDQNRDDDHQFEQREAAGG